MTSVKFNVTFFQNIDIIILAEKILLFETSSNVEREETSKV